MDSLIMLRVNMQKRILDNAKRVRELRGLQPTPPEIDDLFEDLLVRASNDALLNLVVHSTKDVMKHEQRGKAYG